MDGSRRRSKGGCWQRGDTRGRTGCGKGERAHDNAAIILDPSFSQRIPPFGFPRTDVMSNQKLYAIYAAKPSNFTVNVFPEMKEYVVEVWVSLFIPS